MEQLHALTDALGLQRIWYDVEGREQVVSDASLATIAAALGYPAHNKTAIANSLARLEAEAKEPPAMIVTEVGRATQIPANLLDAGLFSEDGAPLPLTVDDWSIPPIPTAGYYRLKLGERETILAVAPPRCPTLAEIGSDKPGIWGPAVQIPALRARNGGDFGTFAELADAVERFALCGADVLAINPVHALFAGHGKGFSPYSPSSRLNFNAAMGDPALVGLPPLPAEQDDTAATELIDWETAMPRREARLRRYFDSLDAPARERIAAEAALAGESLKRQAIYDALDSRFRPDGAAGWQDWPSELRDPESPAVARFAADNADEVAFHLFTQWLARESLAAVQDKARGAGMAIGLLADLAVGVHLGGADTWSMRDQLLEGLTIGAPPDPLGPHGQDWTLTSFSPQGLKRSGYSGWISMLRSALSRAGGLRIDHAFGLARLWVVPEGHPSSEGAYLSYPFEDLVRLAALEANRANALIVAEDLGTAPHGFTHRIEHAAMLGMRVLWFQRAADDGFIGASDYDVGAVAMTGTHDTATLAGWWTGRDLEWADKLGRLPEGESIEDARLRRDWDRGLLWASLTHDLKPRPDSQNPEPVLLAALEHIGRTPSCLAVAPLEDLVGEVEQPNLPGTITEHPNWRRRLAAPLETLLDAPGTAARIAALNQARRDC